MNTKGSSSTFVCFKLCLTCVIKMGSFCTFACFILYKKGLPVIDGSCHKYHFCSDKCFVMTNTCLLRQMPVFHNICLLSRQKYACHDKTFVVTNLCLLQQLFVTTKVLTQQKYFVLTNIILLQQKFLLPQAYFCCDKRCVLS